MAAAVHCFSFFFGFFFFFALFVVSGSTLIFFYFFFNFVVPFVSPIMLSGLFEEFYRRGPGEGEAWHLSLSLSLSFYLFIFSFISFIRLFSFCVSFYISDLGFYWVLLGFAGFCWVLQGFTWFYLIALGFNGSSFVLLGFTGFYWVFLGSRPTGSRRFGGPEAIGSRNAIKMVRGTDDAA